MSDLHSRMGQAIKPYVAVPNYGGNLDADFVTSWTALVAQLAREGVPSRVNFAVHDSLISRGRNRLAHDFLKSDCTHLVFLDADISFVPGDILQLIRAGKPVCGAAYPKKAHGAGFNLNPYPEDLGRGYSEPDEDGWLYVAELATGCMCIERRVLEGIAYASPELLVRSDFPGTEHEVMFAFFLPSIDPLTQRYLSEDYAFCHRARGAGFPISVWTPALLGHAGRYVWLGRLSEPEARPEPRLEVTSVGPEHGTLTLAEAS